MRRPRCPFPTVATVAVATLAALATAVAVAAPARRGSAPPPSRSAPPTTFVESVDVTVVNIDVYVTDNQGHPVTDLTREDFEVRVDGKKVEISNFSAVASPRGHAPGPSSTGQAGTSSGEMGAAAGPPGDPTAAAPEPAPDSATDPSPLQLAVLIDNFNTRPNNRKRVMGQLREFLETELADGDLVMVVSFDGSVNVHQAFTPDRGRVAHALDLVEALPSQGLLADADQRSGLDSARAVLDGTNPVDDGISCAALLEPAIEQYAQATTARVQRTLSALERLVGAMAGLEGRKALLYVSDGLQIRPAADLAYAVADFCSDSAVDLKLQSYDRTADFQRLNAAANAARVTFYPLLSAGTEIYASAEGRGFQDAMALMAGETGGVPLLNVTRVAPALEPVLSDAESHYSLGYTPKQAGTGEEHRIDVAVRRKGVRVRHRQSYLDKPAEERVADRLRSTLWLNGGENPLEVRIDSPGEPTPAEEKGTFRVPVRLGIPIRNLTLLPGDGVHAGRLTVYFTVEAGGTGQAPVRRVEVPFHIPDDRLEEARGQLFGYPLGLVLPAGEHRVGVAVRDEVGQTASYLAYSVKVKGP